MIETGSLSEIYGEEQENESENKSALKREIVYNLGKMKSPL